MLIDRGQTFRVLVVAVSQAGVNIDDPNAIDMFLADEENIASSVQLVKDVYHMDKDKRDSLLYTSEVGVNSAKIGARAASQEFVKNLTKKWLQDARAEGFEVVLVDGRALENIANEMNNEELCDYRMGLYFVCDAIVGARRTLGYASTPYENLTTEQRESVDELVAQIYERNQRDRERDVERMIPPVGASTIYLPNVSTQSTRTNRPMYIVDTSAEISKQDMALPVAQLVAKILQA